MLPGNKVIDLDTMGVIKGEDYNAYRVKLLKKCANLTGHGGRLRNTCC